MDAPSRNKGRTWEWGLKRWKCANCGMEFESATRPEHGKTCKNPPAAVMLVSAVGRERETTYGDDAWSHLHQGRQTEVAHAKSLQEIPTAGLDRDVIATVIGIANSTKLGKAVGIYNEPLGMCFVITHYNPASKVPKIVFDDHLKNKGSDICFENLRFPLPAEKVQHGHLAVAQTKCPCALCCTAYSNWAVSLGQLIVVRYEAGYDRMPHNKTIVFLPTGEAYYL